MELKTPAVFVITCDVCGATTDYTDALPAGWLAVESDRRHVCPTCAARPFAELSAELAPAPGPEAVLPPAAVEVSAPPPEPLTSPPAAA